MSRLGIATVVAVAASIAVAAGFTPACRGTRTVGAPAPSQPSVVEEPPADDTVAVRDAAAPPLPESAARALLADRFRVAGLRVLYDVRIRNADGIDVTLDGFDPARKIGFEYVDPSEVGADLSASERASLVADSELRVLILDPTTSDELAARAARFLSEVASRD